MIFFDFFVDFAWTYFRGWHLLKLLAWTYFRGLGQNPQKFIQHLFYLVKVEADFCSLFILI